MKPFKHFWLLKLIGLIAIVGFVAGKTARADNTTTLSQPAPTWKLTDLNGHEVSSVQLKGKVVVVDFWATWCVPCIGEIAGYIELQKKYGAEGLVIVGVSVDQKGADHVRKFAETKGMNYAIALADDTIADAFGGIDAIPTTFLINRQGQIIHRKVGAMAREEYEKLVQQALHAGSGPGIETK